MKKLALILAFTAAIFVLTSCGDLKEIEDMAYVVAVGIDKGDESNLKITYVIANPPPINGEGDVAKVGRITVEASDVFSGADIMNTNISREVNLTHLKLAIFSSDLAKKGLKDIINVFERDPRLRPRILLAISDGSPSDFLEDVPPDIESDPGKYLDSILSKKISSYVSETTVNDFYNSFGTYDRNVTIPIVGINSSNDKGKSSDDGEDEIDKTQKSDIPTVSENKATVMGLAIFNEDKMVGKITNNWTMYYRLMDGTLSESNFSISDGQEVSSYELTQRSKPKITVNTSSMNPKIIIDASIHCTVVSPGGEYSFEDDKIRIKRKLEKDLSKFLKMTTDTYKADACSIGRYAKKNFLFWDDWKEYNWRKSYNHSSFDINIDPIIENKGALNGG